MSGPAPRGSKVATKRAPVALTACCGVVRRPQGRSQITRAGPGTAAGQSAGVERWLQSRQALRCWLDGLPVLLSCLHPCARRRYDRGTLLGGLNATTTRITPAASKSRNSGAQGDAKTPSALVASTFSHGPRLHIYGGPVLDPDSIAHTVTCSLFPVSRLRTAACRLLSVAARRSRPSQLQRI